MAFVVVINVVGLVVAVDILLLYTEWTEGNMSLASIGCDSKVLFVGDHYRGHCCVGYWYGQNESVEREAPNCHWSIFVRMSNRPHRF